MLRLGALFQQKVLATLLLDAGHVVPLTQLVDVLWDDEPPVGQHTCDGTNAQLWSTFTTT